MYKKFNKDDDFEKALDNITEKVYDQSIQINANTVKIGQLQREIIKVKNKIR